MRRCAASACTHQRRKIKVDLRGKTVGNYNVVIAAKYKTKHGKLHTVRSVRTLSITRY